MSYYKDDKAFTDHVHSVACKIIYPKLKWKPISLDRQKEKRLDEEDGIDYVFRKENGETVTVQERFRDKVYANYNDATLRYRRDYNKNPNEVKSEFFKIKANYLVYGITNGSKSDDLAKTDKFSKWVVLDLGFILKKFKTGEIKVVSNSGNTCKIDGNILKCPVIPNKDRSSSFIPINILCLKKLWNNEPIFYQEGFY